MNFEVIPAIDLKGGKCVRLQQGDAARATEYSDDPVALARYWQEQGAPRLHLVDLDGAFSGRSAHLEVAARIFRALRIPVQFGGGIRTLDEVQKVLDLGAARAILGTVALERADIVGAAVARHGEAVVVGIDARDGRVAVRGWVERSATPALELARAMKALGVGRVIYTDVARDGTLRGANVEETEALARQSGIRVIASGGVSSLDDVRRLHEQRAAGIEGVVLGRALYEGKLDFRAAAATVAEAAEPRERRN